MDSVHEEVVFQVVVVRNNSSCEWRKLNLINFFTGGRGGFQQQSYGPPAQVLGMFMLSTAAWKLTMVVELGKFVHAVEGEIFCESINPKIPYFNAPIYLENKV